MGVVVDEVSTGGTLFANALSMAAGRAALLDILTEEAFERDHALGEQMATGLRTAIEGRACRGAWRSTARTAFTSSCRPPSTAPAREPPTTLPCSDPRLHGQPRRVGVGVVAGPTVSVAHGADETTAMSGCSRSFSPR